MTDTSQNAISRLESPNYGRATVTTLKKLAAVYDVGLVVRFVPFSKLLDWESSTPYIERGLSPSAIDVPSFEEEDKKGALDLQDSPNKVHALLDIFEGGQYFSLDDLIPQANYRNPISLAS
jgi:transcriptional regulator with XRE-family HTH domain